MGLENEGFLAVRKVGDGGKGGIRQATKEKTGGGLLLKGKR